MPNRKYKIALVGYRLSKGGAEKVMAMLSIFFESKGIEVHNIIVIDSVSYPYAGKLFNLGKLKDENNGFFNKLKRYSELKHYLDNNNFDFIIDFRFRVKPIQELLISKYLYKSKTIFSVRSYLIDHYMPNWSVLTRFLYAKTYAVVAVTNQTKELIEAKHGLKNTVTIYNPIDIDYVNQIKGESVALNFDFIIAVGQMSSNVKQFDKLIEAYSMSDLPQKEIHLVILGEGNLMAGLELFAAKKNLADKVHFLGHMENPFKYMRKAKFLVLSSLNEGMPNVILQALACETPVVSFDCLSGPSEIIVNKENGILVENQNVTELAESMNLLIQDEELYNYCKQNTLKSLEKFSMEKIGKQWLDLMQIDYDNNK